MAVIVTGAAGLIGSEAVSFFTSKGHEVIGLDNDLRSSFFGVEASTNWNRDRLIGLYSGYRHLDLDVRDADGVEAIFEEKIALAGNKRL